MTVFAVKYSIKEPVAPVFARQDCLGCPQLKQRTSCMIKFLLRIQDRIQIDMHCSFRPPIDQF
jgi:hypothetical protein